MSTRPHQIHRHEERGYYSFALTTLLNLYAGIDIFSLLCQGDRMSEGLAERDGTMLPCIGDCMQMPPEVDPTFQILSPQQNI